MSYRGLVILGVAASCLLYAGRARAQQAVCQGDLNLDHVVTDADLEALPAVIFNPSPSLAPRADANDDTEVGAADITAIVLLLGSSCPATSTPTSTSEPTRTRTPSATAKGSPTLTPTPSATAKNSATATVKSTPTATSTGPSPTRTATSTPSSTRTPSPTATATQTCSIHTAALDTPINDQLTASDCLRNLKGQLRYTKVYSIVAAPGTGITVGVVGTSQTSPIVPLVEVVDPVGQFGTLVIAPPVEFTVTTSRPYQVWVSTSPSSPVDVGTYTLTLTTMVCEPPVALRLPGSAGALMSQAVAPAAVTATPRTPTATATPKTPTPTPTPKTPTPTRSATPTKTPGPPTSTPTPRSSVTGNLTGMECPDPGAPGAVSISDQTNDSAADIYTFTVSQVPANVSITMQQVSEDDTIYPTFSIRGPDGFEVVNIDQGFDCSDPNTFLLCMQTRFLALQTGTYTIIVTGGGGTGQYTLQLSSPKCTPTALTAIPADHLKSIAGTLSGDTSVTTCAAPLPIPGISDGVPDPSSPADLYTFTAAAGDVISVEMDPDASGYAHLYLLGPAPGNPLVAQDNATGPIELSGNAQLAATLPLPGTYTIVAANDGILFPPDPSFPGDQGETVDYTLFVQKCPAAQLTLGQLVSGSFNAFECVGFGGIPFRSYAFNGTAGQFVSGVMTSPDVDAFVRIFAPDGSRVENDDDLFDITTTDARASRILPVNGTYFLEASTSPLEFVDITEAPAFTLQTTTCQTSPASPGPINGAFQDSSPCEITPGRKFDVYTFSGAAGAVPRVASVAPPPNGCVVALLAEGPQVPTDGCSTDPTDIPVLGSGTYGFMIAGEDETTRGAYTAQFASCALQTPGFGDTVAGSLAGSGCLDTSAQRAAWYLLRGPADLVRFDEGISGIVTTAFPFAGILTDLTGGAPVTNSILTDPASMFPIGSDLTALLKIGSASACSGSGCDYMLHVDPATLLQ